MRRLIQIETVIEGKLRFVSIDAHVYVDERMWIPYGLTYMMFFAVKVNAFHQRIAI